MLAQRGFREVYSLKGGIRAWNGLTAAGPAEQGLQERCMVLAVPEFVGEDHLRIVRHDRAYADAVAGVAYVLRYPVVEESRLLPSVLCASGYLVG